MQLTSLLRLHIDRDNITLIHRACPRQPTSSLLCSYYTLAAAYTLCRGSDPTGEYYDVQTMVNVIDNNLQTGRVDAVPVATQGPIDNLMRQKLLKLHCHCHMLSASCMIECTNCGNWFHIRCMSMTPRQLRRLSAEWNGPYCSQHVKAPPVVVIDDTTPQPSTSRPATATKEPGDLDRYCNTGLRPYT